MKARTLSIAIAMTGLLSVTSQAEQPTSAQAGLCGIENPGAYIRTSLSSTPSYFFGMFANKNLISYRGETSNWIMDLDTGKEFAIPGNEDPVPMPDEKIMSTPRSMRFYSIEDYQNGKKPEPLLNDSELSGVYQSIGTLSSSSSAKPVYRMITDDNIVSYRDYDVSYDNKGAPSIAEDGKVHVICKGLDLKTPKLSKDGQTLAALDAGANPPTMKIYQIRSDDSCKQVDDLGFQTGKVDFSYDGRKIVFHSGTNSMGSRGSYKEHPEKGDRLNVYEMTIGDHQIRQLTFNGDNKNSYYPIYRKNGDVAYIDQTINKDQSEHFDIVVAHTNDVDGVPLQSYLDSRTPNQCHDSNVDPAVLLGRTWLELCSKLKDTSDEQALMRLGALDTKGCHELVAQTWSRIEPEAKHLGVTREALSAACPQSKNFPTLKKIGPESTIRAAQNAQQVFARKCAICHGDSIPFGSPAKMKSTPSSNSGKSFLEEAVRRLKSNDPSVHMPKGSTLSQHDYDLMMDYLGAR